METELNLLHEAMGNIASSYFFAYAIMTFVWGIIADKIGPRKCMLMGMGIITVGLTCMGFMSSLIVGLLGYLLCGAGAAGLSVPLVPLISRWFGGERRGTAFGIALTGNGTLTVTLGVVIPVILAGYSWRWSWWICAAFVCVAAIICWFLLVEAPAENGLASRRQKPSMNPQQIEPKVTIRDVLKRGTGSAIHDNSCLPRDGIYCRWW